MRGILARILQFLDFEVSEAGDGQEGLERLRRLGKPDLVLVDWNMPVMNGLEFVRAVRAEQSYAEMPLVMVTTETETDRVTEVLDAGANEYVMKPFTQDMIVSKLDLLGIAHGSLAQQVPRKIALVIDDSRIVRLILRQKLEALGFEVVEASDGRKGLEILEQMERVDLVLVDQHMPDMDGLTFLQAVRTAGCHDGVRLVMVTGQDGSAQEEAARRAGADDFLVKSSDQEALLATLQKLGLVQV
jgi:two-component system chemotaxis response regulator CheY